MLLPFVSGTIKKVKTVAPAIIPAKIQKAPDLLKMSSKVGKVFVTRKTRNQLSITERLEALPFNSTVNISPVNIHGIGPILKIDYKNVEPR